MCSVWDAMKKHAGETPSQAAKPDATAPAKPAAGEERQATVAAAMAKAVSTASEASDARAALAAAIDDIQQTQSPSADTAAGPIRPTPEEIAAQAQHAVEGVNGYSALLVAHHDRGGALAEEYRSLRTNLLAHCPDQRFCHMVTSADVGEGKTVTCANLAVIMAERQDRRTVIVDFDLRRMSLAKLFRMTISPGVVDVLRGSVRLADAVRPTVYPNLFVLPSGEVQGHEVGELVTRPEMDEMVADLRRRYDYVLFDTPPMNIVAETGMIGRAVGEALLVVRMNKTRRESVEKAIRLLHSANVQLAGMVLTHRTYQIPEYLYKYT